MNKVLVLHFTHPEVYPPALNAINCLSEKVNFLNIITTDTSPTVWKYGENVNFFFVEGDHDRFKFMKSSKLTKFKRYAKFISLVRNSIKKEKPDLVVVYDNVPYLFFLIATIFLKKRYKLWYHNHDIYPASKYSKYGINWYSFYAVQKFFNRIDYFSIPSMERVKMFPMDKFKGKFFFIPNYPSKKIIKTKSIRAEHWNKDKFLKLVYPGSPSIKNGFENLIGVMKNRINGKIVTITIVGEPNEKYKRELSAFAKSNGVENQLFFEDRVPYTNMPKFLRNYHVGWAMYKPMDMRTETVATASNKIYEFLANAMPIIVFDNEHHRQHLSKTEATFFSDLSEKSIQDVLEQIETNYIELSDAALVEFENNYQFEQHFNNVRDEILNQTVNP